MASKPGPSSKNLDPPSTNIVESMDVDYGQALPPCLDSHHCQVNDTSAQHFSPVEECSRLHTSSHSHREYTAASTSALVHYSDQSKDSRPAPSRPKKHSDKSKHKSMSRYVPCSSGEDQPSEVRHRFPRLSKRTYPD